MMETTAIALQITAGLVVLFFLTGCLFFWVRICSGMTVLDAADAAELLYEMRHGATTDLPEKLQGVFWFGDNAAPELLMTFEGEALDSTLRVMRIQVGASYGWTYSLDAFGLVQSFLVKMGYLFGTRLRLYWDEDFRVARIKIYTCFDWLPVPMGMEWDMVQLDEEGHVWDRPIFLTCCCLRARSRFSYTLKKVMDGRGKRLPAFEEMLDSLKPAGGSGGSGGGLHPGWLKASKQLVFTASGDVCGAPPSASPAAGLLQQPVCFPSPPDVEEVEEPPLSV